MQIQFRDLSITILLMFLMFLCSYLKDKKQSFFSWYRFGLLSLACCSTIIFSLTGVSPISGFHTDIRLQDVNFIPFIGIVRMIASGIDFYVIANILGNILMFIPIGFFYLLLIPSKGKWMKPILTGLLVSLIIECSQLFLLRGTDVDDLILNTFGAVIGIFCYFIFAKLFRKTTKKIETANYQHKKLWFYLGIMLPYLVVILGGFFDRYRYFSM